MTDSQRAQRLDRKRSQLSHRCLRLFDQQIENVAGTISAQCSETPEKSFPSKTRRRAQRVSANDVAAASHARIDHHRRAASDLADDCRKDVNRCRKRIVLAAAVIGNDYAVSA